MLSSAPIRAYIPVSNLQRARRFYEQTVGLEPGEEYGGGVIYRCGGAEVFMYPTPNAGTSKASQAFWQVEDVEAEVAELKARGVVFVRPPRTGTRGSGRWDSEGRARASRSSYRDGVAAAPGSPAAAARTISRPDSATPVRSAWSRSNPGPESQASMQPRFPQ